MSERKGSWMQSIDGTIFYPMDPRAEEINLHILASGQSNECRYAGQCNFHYSVAQHAVLMCDAAEMLLLADYSWEEIREIRKCMLFHDSPEGIIKDIPYPMKKQPCMDWYAELEADWEAVIFPKYDIRMGLYGDLVKTYDLRARSTERRDIMSKPPKEWDFSQYPPFPITITEWTPRRAKQEWLRRCTELGVRD